MEQIGILTTKQASELLGISPSTLKAYGLNMENLGYSFKKVMLQDNSLNTIYRLFQMP